MFIITVFSVFRNAFQFTSLIIYGKIGRSFSWIKKKEVEIMSSTPSSSTQAEQKILWVSFLAGAFFAVIEFISAIFTESQSVLMDAAYDSSELIIIILTLFLTPLFHKPVSEERPYGYAQVESIFIIIKSFMMLAVTLSLTFNTIQLALSGGHEVDGKQVALFQLAVGASCALVYLFMRWMKRHYMVDSPTVHAELLGWKIDVAYSGGMAIAFFASTYLERTPLAFLAPYFDQIVAVILVLLTLPDTVHMLFRAIHDVFLFSPEESITDEVKSICDGILDTYEFEPVFYDITRTGRCLWVSVYFRIHEDILSINKLRQASDEVRKTLQEQMGNCSSELIVVANRTEENLLQILSMPE